MSRTTAAGPVPKEWNFRTDSRARGALIDPKLELKLPPAQLAPGELQSHGITAETDDDCWVPKVNAIIISSVPIGWVPQVTHKECSRCAYRRPAYAYNV